MKGFVLPAGPWPVARDADADGQTIRGRARDAARLQKVARAGVQKDWRRSESSPVAAVDGVEEGGNLWRENGHPRICDIVRVGLIARPDICRSMAFHAGADVNLRCSGLQQAVSSSNGT